MDSVGRTGSVRGTGSVEETGSGERETDIMEACHSTVKRNWGKALRTMKADLLNSNHETGTGRWAMIHVHQSKWNSVLHPLLFPTMVMYRCDYKKSTSCD